MFLAQPAFIKVSLGISSFALKFTGLHGDPKNINPAYLLVWITTIHKTGMVVGSIYDLQLTGYVKNLLLTGFEIFSQQVAYLKSRMTYPFGHGAMQSMIN